MSQQLRMSHVCKSLNWQGIALCLCAFNIVTFFWCKSGIEKYLFRYIPIYLSLICVLFSIYENKLKFEISKMDIIWIIFFLYIFTRVNYNNIFDFGLPILYLYSLAMIIFLKTEIEYYYWPLKILFIFSVIYTLSVICQIFFPKTILSFAANYSSFANGIPSQWLLNKIENYAYLGGVVGSVSYAAGYIANNIMMILLRRKLLKISHNRNLLLLASIAALILTGKRAHVLFLIIALYCVLMLITIKKYKFQNILKSVLFVFCGCLCVFIGMQLFPHWGIFARIDAMLINISSNNFSLNSVTSGRMEIYRSALLQFAESPVWGIGLRNFQYYFPDSTTPLSAHNFYIQILCETGIIGFSLLIIAQLYTLLKTYRRLLYVQKHKEKPYLQFCMAYALCFQIFFILYGMTESIFYYHGYILLYFFVCCIVNTHHTKEIFVTA